MSNSEPISITICGDGGTGKSSITLRLVRSAWTSDYDPTIEDSYSVSRTVDGQSYTLSLTDTAGQEEYRGLWAASNLHADAFLLVYDLTAPSSLPALQPFYDLITMEADTRAEKFAALSAAGAVAAGNSQGRGPRGESTIRPVVMVAGNKCDRVGERAVSAREGLEWARAHTAGFMETSARNVVNIEETFALIVRRVVANRRDTNLGHGGGSGPVVNSTNHTRPVAAVSGMSEKVTNEGSHGVAAAEVRESKEGAGKQGRWAWARRLRCW